MYTQLRTLLESGYEVTLRPVKGDKVKLTVQEARNGTVKAVEVDLIQFEWAFSQDGIAERLDEALQKLNISAS